MNNTIPAQFQNVFEAMFACVEDNDQAVKMSVAQVVEHLDTIGWNDVLDFLNDPRIFQDVSDKATRTAIIEVCDAYPHYDYAETMKDAKAEADAFLAEFN